MDPFLGQIIMFAGNFAPSGWAFCSGQLLSIASNSALFSILGTTYGGDGETTFGLPDLRGRAPIHAGQGAGLSNYRLGQRNGVENVALTQAQMPSHSHGIQGSTSPADSASPSSAAFPATASVEGRPVDSYTANGPEAIWNSDATGGGQTQTNLPPRLAVNFIIALQGTFPSPT